MADKLAVIFTLFLIVIIFPTTLFLVFRFLKEAKEDKEAYYKKYNRSGIFIVSFIGMFVILGILIVFTGGKELLQKWAALNSASLPLTLLTASSFAYGLHCQAKVRNCISEEKFKEIGHAKNIRRIPMPSKEILTEEGLAYYKKWRISTVIFLTSVLLLMLLRG
ncbi:MAG: hypothetical protein JW844_08330 [Candidatus Omnitrophica bacterium]|nr:hypothetical protein [Candidatus Omnitrophota bacterium]